MPLNWYDKRLTAEDRQSEKWLPIPETDDKYDISSLGRVISHFGRYDKNLTPQVNNYGQLSVQITTTHTQRKDHMKLVMIGKTVARLYVENPHGYKYIRFKNGDETDCRACNIEWCAKTDKMQNQYRTMYKRVNQYTLDGKYLATYNSIGEAIEQTGFARIGEACKNKTPANNYLWRLTSEALIGKDIPPYVPPKRQGYVQLDKKTKAVIRHYANMDEVIAVLSAECGDKVNRGNVQNCARGKRPSAYGYKWEYEK